MNLDPVLLYITPQGSCGGSVLYNIYPNTMGKLTQGYLDKLLGFADDKTLFDTFNLNSNGDEDGKRHDMENCLSGTAEWT